MNDDDFLYKFRKPPRREFAAALYQRISNGDSKPMKTSFRTRALRAAALAFTMVALIAAVLFFSPTTRAFAQSILHQFGSYVFVEGTTELDAAKQKAKQEAASDPAKLSPEQEATLTAEKMLNKDQPADQQVEATKPAKPAAIVAPDAAAASQQAGFTVLAPAYVPAGYVPRDEQNIPGGWEIAHENGGVAARTRYINQASGGFIVVEELKYEPGQRTHIVERPQIVDVTVRGQTGAWMPDNNGKSTLAWDENGITYLVVGNTLSLDEAQKIAESLAN